MGENVLKLSYLELSNSNFNFPVYRKSYDYNSKGETIYRYTLPTTQLREDRDEYAVSFTPIEYGTPFECNSYDNIHLTKKWLTFIFTKQVQNVLSGEEYIIGRRFIPNISFIVAKYKEGQQLVQMDPYYLESNRSFGFLIDFKFRANKGFEKTREEKILSLSMAADGSKNKNLYSDKLKIVSFFIHNNLDKIFPINSSHSDVDIARTMTELEANLLGEKVYEFERGQSKVQFQGLKEYGPLSGIDKDPLYIFVFEKSKINVARQLVKALRGQLYSTFSGMEKMFGVRFSNDNIKTITVDDFSKESFPYVAQMLDKMIAENASKQIVGIFAGIAKDFDTGKDYSPYYTVKSIFLERGLAVQAITIEHALKKDGFKWSISGIALQIFVKLGGKPWKVKPQNDNCLIFGISNAHIKNDDGKVIKYFAYSLCFDSSGLYKKLDVLGQSSDEDTYISQLATQIKKNLNEELVDNITKCVIHVPFKIRKKEIRCIRDAINAIKPDHSSVEFVVIKINTDNKFFGYSQYNSLIPLAGSYVQLAKREYLVWFEGLQQGRIHIVSAQNISNPVHIHFWDGPELREHEIKAYLQDIVNLSGASWRGFNAKHVPVTTLYPDLFAHFAGKFDQYGLEMSIGDSALDKVWFI